MNRATSATRGQCGLSLMPIRVRTISGFVQEPGCWPVRGPRLPRYHLWLGIAIAASWLVASAIASPWRGVDAPAIYIDDWDAIRFP